ncbi:unnamed protein product [Calicophoron daubneyi]|uniref:TLDc domain-containing protein n=1 Tax=Calicophoron daubneyi TaxID=300641 RepID=A0AAV2THC8_CALDB
MGNVESEEPGPTVVSASAFHYVGFTDHGNKWMIEKEIFIRKLNPLLETLGEALWSNYAELKFMSLEQYEMIIKRLTARSDHVSFFLSLLNPHELTVNDILVALSWFKLGETVDSELNSAMSKPVLSSLHAPYTVEDVSRRLSTLYPNLADDLTKTTAYALINGEFPMITLRITNNFTILLNHDIYWLLSVVLDPPYKRPCETILNHVAPLELEQLGHLHCLYDSVSNGCSITKIKELAFDYEGPLIMLLRTDRDLFCLVSDQGLRDSMKTYGTENSKLYRFLPEFAKLVSGRSAKLAGPGVECGIIYSNLTAKTIRRGLLVGHQPLVSPAIEINEGFTELIYAGGVPLKLLSVEIWAAGSSEHLKKLQEQRAFDNKMVDKEKNRKIKVDADWKDSPDRILLNLAGVGGSHSVNLPPEQRENGDTREPCPQPDPGS